MPADYCIEIFLSWLKIPKCRMCDTICHHLLYRRHRGKIHIRHPHRKHRKSFLHLHVLVRNLIYCQCVFSFSIHNRCKIKFHPFFPLSSHCHGRRKEHHGCRRYYGSRQKSGAFVPQFKLMCAFRQIGADKSAAKRLTVRFLSVHIQRPAILIRDGKKSVCPPV